MKALIFNKSGLVNDPDTIRLLKRHYWLLMESGITDIRILSHPDGSAVAEDISSLWDNLYGTKETGWPKHIPEDHGGLLLIDLHSVYSYEFLAGILARRLENAVVIDPTAELIRSPWAAEAEKETLKEVWTDPSSSGQFRLAPVIRLDQEVFERNRDLFEERGKDLPEIIRSLAGVENISVIKASGNMKCVLPDEKDSFSDVAFSVQTGTGRYAEEICLTVLPTAGGVVDVVSDIRKISGANVMIFYEDQQMLKDFTFMLKSAGIAYTAVCADDGSETQDIAASQVQSPCCMVVLNCDSACKTADHLVREYYDAGKYCRYYIATVKPQPLCSDPAKTCADRSGVPVLPRFYTDTNYAIRDLSPVPPQEDDKQQNEAVSAGSPPPAKKNTISAELKKKRYRFLRTLRFRYYRATCVPKDRQVIFISYHGKEYSCNPKAMYNAMLKSEQYKGFTFVWVFQSPGKFTFIAQKPRTSVVKWGSAQFYRALAESKYWVNNVTLPDGIGPGKNQVYVNTWHGKPIKHIGCDAGVNKDYRTGTGGTRQYYIKIFTAMARQLTWIFGGAEYFNQIMISAFNLKKLGRESIVKNFGFPRNSALFTADEDKIFRIKLRLGISLDKKVILYAPTWRPYVSKGNVHILEMPFDPAALLQELGEDYVILLRGHNLVAKSFRQETFEGNVLNVTHVSDINDLYLISDMMVTDYSSAIFDYALLKRPIILYVYDREKYENESAGVYLNIDDFPFPKVYEKEKLASCILTEMESFEYSDAFKAFNDTFNPNENADCALNAALECIDPNTKISSKATRILRRRKILRLCKKRLRSLLKKCGINKKQNDQKQKKSTGGKGAS